MSNDKKTDPDVARDVIRAVMNEVKDEFLEEMRAQEGRFLAKVDEQFGKYAERVEKAIEEAIRVNKNHSVLNSDVSELKESVKELEKFLPLMRSLAKLHDFDP